jgi:thiol-disulfide isomerase/thioredoxin
MKKFFLPALLIALLTVVGSTPAMAAKKAPDFKLKATDGKRYQLKDVLKDEKLVLIDFWATWCTQCHKLLPHLKTMEEKYREDGFKVVIVSIDSTNTINTVKSNMAGRGYKWLTLLDPTASLKRKYQFDNIPFTVLISGEGELIWTHAGYQPGQEKEIEEQVTEFLKVEIKDKAPAKEESAGEESGDGEESSDESAD